MLVKEVVGPTYIEYVTTIPAAKPILPSHETKESMPGIFEGNNSFVTFKRLEISGDTIPIVNFSNQPIKAAMDESIKWLSVCILVEVMLSLGCSVNLQALKKYIKRPFGVGIAVLSQFILMPLLAFGGIILFNIPHIPAVVILVTASLPGGTISNMLSYLADGDITLSTIMTMFSTVLSFLFIPLNLFVYGSNWLPEDIDYIQLIPYPIVLMSLSLMLLPVGIGIALSWRFPDHAEKIVKVCKCLIVVTILGLIILSALLYDEVLLRYISKELWVASALMPLIGFIIGFVMATLTRESTSIRRTVALETMCQNGLMGCVILKVAFPSHLIGSLFLLPLLFSLFQFVEGLIIVALVRYKIKTEVEQDKKKGEDFSGFGEFPGRKLRRVSLYVIDQMRQRFSISEKSDKSDTKQSESVSSDDTNEVKKKPSTTSFPNNIIKNAIAEEPEEAWGVVTSQLSDMELGNNNNAPVLNNNNIIETAVHEKDEAKADSANLQLSDVESHGVTCTSDCDEDDENMLIYTTGSSFEDIDFSTENGEN